VGLFDSVADIVTEGDGIDGLMKTGPYIHRRCFTAALATCSSLGPPGSSSARKASSTARGELR
jgi:hypothetical protein